MSRHESRQRLATEFGATDIVAERGDEGVERVKDLTDGIGADAVLECVGTSESMGQAMSATRPGGRVGLVGVPHGVSVDGTELFYSHVQIGGGPAPVRRFLPDLIERIVDRRIDPGKVFDLTLPLEQAAEGYARDGRAPRHQVAAPALTLPATDLAYPKGPDMKTTNTGTGTGGLRARPGLHGDEPELRPAAGPLRRGRADPRRRRLAA